LGALKRTYIATVTLGFLVAASLLRAQPAAGQTLEDRSVAEIRLGVRGTSGSSTLTGGQITETEAGGLLAYVTYSHWTSENTARMFSIGYLPSEVATYDQGAGWQTESAFALAFLFGFKRFLGSDPAAGWRSYFSGQLGPVVGVESSGRIRTGYGVGSSGSNVVGTRLGVGARVGAGVNGRLNDLLVLGLSVEYGLFTNSWATDAALGDHTGPTFEIGLGVVLPPKEM